MAAPILICSSDPRSFASVMPALKIMGPIKIADNIWKGFQKGKDPLGLALIDIELEGGNGVEVARSIRAQSDGLNAPILLFARNRRVTAKRALKEGLIDDFFETGTPPGVLMTKIAHIREKYDEVEWDGLNKLQCNMLKVSKSAYNKMVGAAKGEVEPEEAKLVISECAKAVTGLVHTPDISSVLNTLKGHHNYSFVHSMKVAAFMTIFGTQIGIRDHELEVLAQAGLIHDIGKMMTPPEILEKPSKLDDDEWAIMKNHPADGADFLRDLYPDIPEIVEVAESHHEKMDGSGYPHGVKGRQLSEITLIAAVSDVYSALTDKRSYKPAMSNERAIAILDSMAGDHLEPKLVKKFIELVSDHSLGLAA